MTDEHPVQEPGQPLPPGYPPYAAYPPYPAYAYPPRVNVYAILALVFSAMIFPPVGIVLGYKARRQIAQTGERGSELATAGIVVGWIFPCIYGLFFIVWCGFMGAAIVSSGNGG